MIEERRQDIIYGVSRIRKLPKDFSGWSPERNQKVVYRLD